MRYFAVRFGPTTIGRIESLGQNGMEIVEIVGAISVRSAQQLAANRGLRYWYCVAEDRDADQAETVEAA